MSRDERIDSVLSFWFGTTPEEIASARDRWFTRDIGFDARIRDVFGPLYEAATRGELDAWIEPGTRTADSVLAYVVVLDQFSRNLFRDSGRAYECDGLALAAVDLAITEGLDRTLPFVRRYMLYMPLMHSESPDVQRRSVVHFGRLATEAAGEPDAAMYRAALDYAERHARIVERFGRFPHRNRLLDRTTTAEEASFLLEPGSSF